MWAFGFLLWRAWRLRERDNLAWKIRWVLRERGRLDIEEDKDMLGTDWKAKVGGNDITGKERKKIKAITWRKEEEDRYISKVYEESLEIAWERSIISRNFIKTCPDLRIKWIGWKLRKSYKDVHKTDLVVAKQFEISSKISLPSCTEQERKRCNQCSKQGWSNWWELERNFESSARRNLSQDGEIQRSS